MLVAIGGAGGKIALAAADISTGRFEALCVEEHSLHAELARLRASEIVLAEDLVLDRSEEHTSELQSLMRISYAVFCLKNKITSDNLLYAISTIFYQAITDPTPVSINIIHSVTINSR